MIDRSLLSSHAVRLFGTLIVFQLCPALLLAQSVGLPAPRLLTTMPTGGQIGTTIEVTITGENVDDPDAELLFSNPGIRATHLTDAAGSPIPNKFRVTIDPASESGICDARVMTHMGISSSRAFTVGKNPEQSRNAPNNTIATAQKLENDSVLNSHATGRSIDFYTFESKAGTRTIIECAAPRIDSRLAPVLIVADHQGRDLKVDRLNGLIEFIAPSDGTYVVKVHDKTFQGGPEYFYRLALTTTPEGSDIVRQPGTRQVCDFSAPPASLLYETELEPNQQVSQQIQLPCEVSGRFFPAADVDSFEFVGTKGDVWWIEVVSQRLGLPTNPFVLVQKVVPGVNGAAATLTDVAEFNDIPHPLQVSSNGYSYDGPPYYPGSADALGTLTIPEDGTYRIQLRDLFGGTRNDPVNEYRLIIRKPTPDFALICWAKHLTLRNGDRAALSKPIALRPGTTMVFDVVAIRKDGFNGDIDIVMEGLPEGVTATGLKIAAGRATGTLLITASESAPRNWAVSRIVGRGNAGETMIERDGSMASMAWPVRDAWGEIPKPRLMVDIPVSVGDADAAPLTIAPAENKVWEVVAGQKISVPLKLTWRGEFSGALVLSPLGAGLEGVKSIDVPLNAPSLETEIDSAALKLTPGEYVLGLHGGVVSRYRERMDRLKQCEDDLRVAEENLQKLLTNVAANDASEEFAAQRQAAEKIKADAEAKLKAAQQRSNPQEIADIVVSEPIRILVTPASGS
ncbi:serine protease [Planctomicrobium sp. SH668]|uniref:serine protease n=1 Tax=Planctomicrobium sp. SH668 TaxID=3448126 RepID=UPI003F5B9C8C